MAHSAFDIYVSISKKANLLHFCTPHHDYFYYFAATVALLNTVVALDNGKAKIMNIVRSFIKDNEAMIEIIT